MAAGARGPPMSNGTQGGSKAVELAIDLPHSPGLRVNLHLTVLAASIVLFLTSTSTDSAPGATSMGSFVYAMPDRYNPGQPMSTVLYSSTSSLDFATRMAKVLAHRLKKPCYVGSSISLSTAVGGGSVDEEMEAFRFVVQTVCTQAS